MAQMYEKYLMLYTSIQFGKGYVVVGIDVKQAGRNLIVNSISTVFGKSGKVTESEVEIYRDEKINLFDSN